VDKANEVGFLEGFWIGNNFPMSHLLFVDETLIFYKPIESNLGYLRFILLLFEAMSSLRVSFQKVFSFLLVRFLIFNTWLSSLVAELITSHRLS